MSQLEQHLSRQGDRLSGGVGARERRARREEQLRAQLKKLNLQLEEAERRAGEVEAEAGRYVRCQN